MTDKEILKKVFNITYSNGWRHSYSITWESGYFTPITQDKQYYKIIFSHDFCKALWGTHKERLGSGEWQIAYCYHLKQMVMCSNPIKYLEKFL